MYGIVFEEAEKLNRNNIVSMIQKTEPFTRWARSKYHDLPSMILRTCPLFYNGYSCQEKLKLYLKTKSDCKDLLPAPGNRSNETRYRKKDLSTRGEKGWNEERTGSKKIDLFQLARDLDESSDPSISKIVLRDLIISSKYYKEEEAKELLDVNTAERLETEQKQTLEQQEQLSIEKLRLEIE
ncbi:hypothetical protein TNCV_1983291 [Trichonephila clavipes]|nr:hypothetical protein TNCV_1983291 [Trichonephila clavipes]